MRSEVYWCDQCATTKVKRRAAVYRVFLFDKNDAPVDADRPSADACVQHLPIIIRQAWAVPRVDHVAVHRASPG